MTDEQIKQNAEEYANSMRLSTENPPSDYHIGIYDGYIAGAHSRDREVMDLEHLLKAERTTNKVLAEANEKLRNSWINASKQLPPEDKEGSNISIDCLVMSGDGNSFFYVIAWYDYSSECWYEKYDFYQTHLDGNKVYYWMELPKYNHIETEGDDK